MSMQSIMAGDLAQLFKRDLPSACRIGGQDFTVLVDDTLSEEMEAYGGPESIEMQRVHFLTTDKATIENGSKLALKQGEIWKSKIVVSSITSADGNELIATVRGD
jgi:hypothetical protein